MPYMIVRNGRVKRVKKSKAPRIIFADDRVKVVCVKLRKNFLPAVCRIGPLVNLLAMC